MFANFDVAVELDVQLVRSDNYHFNSDIAAWTDSTRCLNLEHSETETIDL